MTISEKNAIINLYQHGMAVKDIHADTGINVNTIYTVLHTAGIKLRHDYPRMKYYVVYDRKDNVIAQGSAKECAATLGIKVNSFYRRVVRQRETKVCRIVTMDCDEEYTTD